MAPRDSNNGDGVHESNNTASFVVEDTVISFSLILIITDA